MERWSRSLSTMAAGGIRSGIDLRQAGQRLTMPAAPFNRILDCQPRRDRRARDPRLRQPRHRERCGGLRSRSRQPCSEHCRRARCASGPRPPRRAICGRSSSSPRPRAPAAEAIHPGYGFLSERAHFSRMCAEAGITFIGPSPEAIEAMGDKLSAVQLAERPACRACRAPGASNMRPTPATSLERHRLSGADQGQRRRRRPRHAHRAREADIAHEFVRPRRGEVGLRRRLAVHREIHRARTPHRDPDVGRQHGNVVHLGERDCSTQRRHQKLIEEAPSPVVDAELRQQLAEAP